MNSKVADGAFDLSVSFKRFHEMQASDSLLEKCALLKQCCLDYEAMQTQGVIEPWYLSYVRAILRTHTKTVLYSLKVRLHAGNLWNQRVEFIRAAVFQKVTTLPKEIVQSILSFCWFKTRSCTLSDPDEQYERLMASEFRLFFAEKKELEEYICIFKTI